MAELFGKETGVTGGRGGSMHLFDVSKSFMGGYAIVAGHMPLACGLALAEQYKGTDRIAVNFFGDGAVNEGEFHEALNLAAVWKLPVLFICENNFYGMGTDVRRVSAVIEIYKRAEAYAIAAEQVDGMDVLAVHEAVAEAAQRVRAGEGPVFLEAICYRFRGHSMADPEFYRDKDEVEVVAAPRPDRAASREAAWPTARLDRRRVRRACRPRPTRWRTRPRASPTRAPTRRSRRCTDYVYKERSDA